MNDKQVVFMAFMHWIKHSWGNAPVKSADCLFCHLCKAYYPQLEEMKDSRTSLFAEQGL